MFFNYITLLTALLISSVAIFFSVAGLVAIFPAYQWSIICMGSVIEVGKLVAAIWLHKNWSSAVWWLKWSLASQVAVVMFITSMGIFGYLSKSHVEQTGAANESKAQVQRIQTELARNEAIIERANTKIKNYGENGSSLDSSLNRQIDKEQTRIDSAYSRVQPSINAQMATIKAEQNNIKSQQDLYRNEIKRIDAALKTATEEEKVKLNKKRRTALWRVRTAASANGAVKAARKEIASIRKSVKAEIAASNKLINRLRLRMGKSTEQDIEKLIGEQQTRIKDANTALDTLTEQKFKLESAYRKLEAEVGPIKYIAKFIYDEADANLLEKAVTWVIILIIFVFDPFAILLLIATQYSFERTKIEIELAEVAHKLEEIAETEKYLEEEIHNVEDKVDSITENVPEATAQTGWETAISDSVDYFHAEVEDIANDAMEYADAITDEPELTIDDIAASAEVEELDTTDEVQSVLSDLMENAEVEELEEPEVHDQYKELFESPADVLEADEVEEAQDEVIEVEIAEPEEPWENLNELSTIVEEIKTRDDNQAVFNLTKVGENYINYNGKVYRNEALQNTHPELKLDFIKPVDSGRKFPKSAEVGKLFLRSDLAPTKLFRFNGTEWNSIDKNLLHHIAYSRDYINELIKVVGEGEYNPELLNTSEKHHIEAVLTE